MDHTGTLTRIRAPTMHEKTSWSFHSLHSEFLLCRIICNASMLKFSPIPIVRKVQFKHKKVEWSLTLIDHEQKHRFCQASHYSNCRIFIDNSLQSVDLSFIFYCLNEMRTLRRKHLKHVQFIAIEDEIGNTRKNVISCAGDCEPLLYDGKKIDVIIDPDISPVCLRVPSFAFDSSLQLEARIHTANKLRETIDPFHQPPQWPIDIMQKLPLFTSTLVFYDSNSTSDDSVLLSQVKQTYQQKQPACINMTKCFNKDIFLSTFGFQASFYEQYFQMHTCLPANIGIYSLTYVSKESQHSIIHPEQDILKNLEKTPAIHQAPMHFYIVSVYTFITDHPDTLYFAGTNDIKKRIHSAYKCIFKKLYAACLYKDLTHICMPPIGLVSCDELSMDIPFISVWLEQFATIHNYYYRSGITVSLMHCSPELATQITSYCPMTSYIKSHTSLHACISVFSDDLISQTMFVSEMDPIAYPGNGFYSDLSVNAKIGASTSLWMTANGMINPIHDSSFIMV